jgi:hypothetical protein
MHQGVKPPGTGGGGDPGEGKGKGGVAEAVGGDGPCGIHGSIPHRQFPARRYPAA